MSGDKSFTSRIRAEARRLGFFKMGVVPAGPLPWTDRFDEWLERGMHGSMAYMPRQAEKRKNPALVLDEVRSILILAMNYHTSVGVPDDPQRGRITRYAWGNDYHRVLEARLCELLEFIVREKPASCGLYYADTGPVMEKVWGARSTLGWMGKHSNLITREQGSWFFIGVILLNQDLEYDEPGKDHCGKCTRCLSVCPTGAIVAPYVVDARLCISYLTIELKGAIPRHLRPPIGNRIFGCDDCQEACPWNRFAVPSPEDDFWPRDGNYFPQLADLAFLDEHEFNARFKDSPVRRARRDGFVRNVAVALGNSHREGAIPVLSRLMTDSSALVRAHAAWALGEIASHLTPDLRPQTSDQIVSDPITAARSALEKALSAEKDKDVQEEITLSISRVA